MINNNTTAMHPTHFLQGVALIDRAMKEFGVASENWAYPTQYTFGVPIDEYYAEIWCNGMDWQPNFWIIEEAELNPPRVRPFIIFDDHHDREIFNDYDFSMLIRGALYYRRDCVFVKHDDYGVYTDMVWPYIHLLDHERNFKVMKQFQFFHSSQEPVDFWMNPMYMPEYVDVLMEEEDEEDRSDRNPQTELGGSVEESGGCIIKPFPGR